LEIVKGMLQLLARTGYVRRALAAPADLGALRRRPTLRVWFGLGLVLLSYTIGWPCIALLGYIAYRVEEPLLLAVGGPILYGLSHLTFLAGAWLAGANYARIFLHWATRRAYQKHGWTVSPQDPPSG
jgi:hypothetical protein